MLEEFLKELTELTKKHGLAIGGCGCCGSPFIYEVKDKNKEPATDLIWDEKLEKYTYYDEEGKKV